MRKVQFTIGDRVRFTAAYLRNTGQQRGGEGQSVWTITGFDNGGDWAITDQPTDTSYFTAAELSADPTLAFRRIAVANLCLASRPDGSAL